MKLKQFLFGALAAVLATGFVSCEKSGDNGGDTPTPPVEKRDYVLYAKGLTPTSTKITVELTSPGGEGKSATKAYYLFAEAADQKIADILKITDKAAQAKAAEDYAKANATLVSLPFTEVKSELKPSTEYVIIGVGYDEAKKAFNTACKITKVSTAAEGLGEIYIKELDLWSYGYKAEIGTKDPAIKHINYFFTKLGNSDSPISKRATDIMAMTDEAAKMKALDDMLWTMEWSGSSIYPNVIFATEDVLPLVRTMTNTDGSVKEGDKFLVVAMGVGDDARYEVVEDAEYPDGTKGTRNIPKATRMTELIYHIITTKKNPIDEADIEYSTASSKIALVAGSVKMKPGSVQEDESMYEIEFTAENGATKVAYAYQGDFFPEETEQALYKRLTAIPERYDFTGGKVKIPVEGGFGNEHYMWISFDKDGKAGKPQKATVTVTKPVTTTLSLEARGTRTSYNEGWGEATFAVEVFEVSPDVKYWTICKPFNPADDESKILADWGYDKMASEYKAPTAKINFQYTKDEGTDGIPAYILAADATGATKVLHKILPFPYDKENFATKSDPNFIVATVPTKVTMPMFSIVGKEFGTAVQKWGAFLIDTPQVADPSGFLRQFGYSEANKNMYKDVTYKTLTNQIPMGKTEAYVVLVAYDGTTSHISPTIYHVTLEAPKIVANKPTMVVKSGKEVDGEWVNTITVTCTFTGGPNAMAVEALLMNGYKNWGITNKTDWDSILESFADTQVLSQKFSGQANKATFDIDVPAGAKNKTAYVMIKAHNGTYSDVVAVDIVSPEKPAPTR